MIAIEIHVRGLGLSHFDTPTDQFSPSAKCCRGLSWVLGPQTESHRHRSTTTTTTSAGAKRNYATMESQRIRLCEGARHSVFPNVHNCPGDRTMLRPMGTLDDAFFSTNQATLPRDAQPTLEAFWHSFELKTSSPPLCSTKQPGLNPYASAQRAASVVAGQLDKS